jgi:putative DNA primase/helicase
LAAPDGAAAGSEGAAVSDTPDLTDLNGYGACTGPWFAGAAGAAPPHTATDDPPSWEAPPPTDADAPVSVRRGGGDGSGNTGDPRALLPDGVMPGTDLATAHLLTARHGRDLVFVPAFGWLAWDKCRWAPDATGLAMRHIHEIGRWIERFARSLRERAEQAADDKERAARLREAKIVWTWAQKAQGEIGMRHALKVAEALLSGDIADFDKDHWLLNVESGTIDLRTGKQRKHDREDRITKLAPVSYSPNAEAPLWDAVLERVLPVADVREFVLRMFGYGLTASTGEQCMFLLHGGGANGKSTVLETVRRVLGDYAAHAQTDTFMRVGSRGADNDLARLRGARLVTAIESGEGRKLDEERVKTLTGSDTVTARFLYHEPFEFRPVMKVIIATNNKPTITNDDDAIWRRLKLVGFDVQIPEGERDGALQEKLAAEASGILGSLVRACLEWQRIGLCAPESVSARTQEWREDSDTVGQFVAEECVAGPHLRSKSSWLYGRYSEWCRAQGIEPPSQKGFSEQLLRRGYSKEKTKTGAFWQGLGVEMKVTGDG